MRTAWKASNLISRSNKQTFRRSKATSILLSELAEKTIRINENVVDIARNTSSIKTSSSNTATQLGTIKEDTGSLTSSVGLPADEASANTVIGLLKSISNKLS